MDKSEVDKLLMQLDGSGSNNEWKAIERLRSINNFPDLLLERYKHSKKWNERASCVYHSTRYAKERASSLQLGILALKDKSKIVRYRATMLLAVSQKVEAIKPLEELLASELSTSDAAAAIKAILEQNQNLFVDRENSGKMFLKIH